MERYFKRLNTLLLFIVVFFAAFLIYAQNKAYSQMSEGEEQLLKDLGIDPNGNVKVIDTQFAVNFKDIRGQSAESFDVAFQSDGNNNSGGTYEDLQKKGVPPIDIPLKFDITDAHIDTAGTPIYRHVKSITAPFDATCDDTKQGDCLVQGILTNAHATKVWENAIMLQVSGIDYNDVKQTVNITPDSAGTIRWSTIMNALNMIRSLKLIFSNAPDHGRISLGSVSFWADDEIQQIARVNGKLINDVTIEVKSVEVTRAVEYSIQQFSSTIPSNLTAKVGYSNLSSQARSSGISVIPDYNDQQDDVIKDPNTLAGFLSTLFPPKEQEQKRLGVHVPLRKVEEADTFGASYDFCAATGPNEKNVGSSSFRNKNLPHPFPEEKNPVIGPDGQPVRDIFGNPIYEDDDNDKQSRFDNLGGDTRRCVDAVGRYQGPDAQQSCAEQLVDNNGSGCREFSVEETDLHFTQVENPRDIAISMGAYMRNAVFNDINTNVDGPWVNYLAPRFCASLTIHYDIKPGKNYIYRYGGGAGGSQSSYDNQYCVVGAVLSNYSWVMHEQDNYFSSQVLDRSINMYKDALTCDKKETAIFGATPVSVDNPAPQGRLVYEVRDNFAEVPGGYGRVNPDSLMIYHGNDPFSLDPILAEVNSCYKKNSDGSCTPYSKPISVYRYANASDIRVLVGENDKPKYVIFVTQKTDESNPDPGEDRRLMLCRVDYAFGGQPVTDGKPLCKEVYRSNKLMISGFGALNKVKDADVITLINRTEDDHYKIQARTVTVDPTNIENSVVTEPVDIDANTPFTFDIKAITYRGRVAILTTKFNDSNSAAQLTIFDPVANKIVFQNQLCSGQNDQLGYCALLRKYPVTSKIVYEPTTDRLMVVVLGGFTGLVFTPNPGGGEVVPAKMFIFNKNNKINAPVSDKEKADAEKEIERIEKSGYTLSDEEKDAIRAKVNPGSDEVSTLNDAEYDYKTGTLYAFISSKTSSYMLKIIDPERYKIESTTAALCGGNNCLVTTQKEFNPATFTWDCSDYFGTGTCGSKKMSKTGYPRVIYATINSNGKISAWYQYSELAAHAIFYSPDFEYSLNGVYKQVKDKEYSNVYVPFINPTPASENDKILAAPISNPGPLGKLYVGVHLQDSNGTISEMVNELMKPGKPRCLDILNTKVEDDDDFYKIPGIQKPAFVTTQPKTDPGGMTGFNPAGKYCEETWCVLDNFSLTENPKFKLQSSGGTMTESEFTTLKDNITNWLNGRPANRKYGDYRNEVNHVCDESQKAGIPCQVLIGIWIQESSAQKGNGTVFGCFAKGMEAFDDQITCAINVIVRGANIYDGKDKGGEVCSSSRVCSGPGSEYTPNPQGPPKPGQCEAATRFSLIMNRYTPLDKHINFNNQCNRGLVEREDNAPSKTDPTKICYNDLHAKDAQGNPVSKNDGSVKWPNGNLSGSGTRPNLEYSIEEINNLLPDGLKVPISKSCYKSDGGSGGGGGSDDQSIAALESKYERVPTIDSQHLNLDFNMWNSTSGPAGNVHIAFDLMRENVSSDELKAKFTGAAGNNDLIYVIAPGQRFSFNDALTNSKFSTLMPKYNAKIKDPAYSKYHFSTDPDKAGLGWCDLATGIRALANRMTYTGQSTNYVFKENGPLPWSGARIQYKAPIESKEHSNEPVESYNKLLDAQSAQKYQMLTRRVTSTAESQLLDKTKFVSIFISADGSDAPGNGDLKIFNNTLPDYYLIIKLHRSPSDPLLIGLDMYYAKPKSNAPTPSPTSNTTGEKTFEWIKSAVDRRRYLG